jgi:hypothetical protein
VSDSAESSCSDDMLATDSPEATVAEALDLKRDSLAEDASWGSDSPQMRSIASESKHDGTSNAKLAETDSHDAADMNNEYDVMNGVSDMVHDLEEAARTRPTHRYKLQQRPRGHSKLELKKERKVSGGDVPRVCTPRPSPRKSRTLQYEVSDVVDVHRMGKKDNGSIVFRVLWDAGECGSHVFDECRDAMQASECTDAQ